MSLGDVGTIGTCTDGGIREAICHSVAAGVTYVAAAGNSTVDTSTFIPAAFPEVIAVSALTDLDGEPGGLAGCWLFFFFCDDTLAEFSNYGATVDVTAPGTQIYSDLDRRRLCDRDGHEHGLAARGGRGRADPRRQPGPHAGRGPGPPEVDPGSAPTASSPTPTGTPTASARASGATIPTGSPSRSSTRSTRSTVGRRAMRGRSIRITSPTDGAIVSAPVTVTATATDDIGVTKVEFFVDGVLTATDTNGSDGWSFTWSPNVDGAGYVIKATATDTIGQTSSRSVSVRTSPGVQGSWVGTYGHDGYILANWDGTNADLSNLPAGVTYALELGARATWVSPTSDVRALTNPAGTERRSQTFYAADKLRVRLSFANAYSGTLHLYAVDWDAYGGNRYENITVDDGSGPRVAHLLTTFVPGAWIHAPISVPAGGSVTVTVDRTAGNSAVLAGLFLGGASAPPPPPPSLPFEIPGVQGTWLGHYGADGYVLANWDGNNTDLASLPAGVTYALEAGRTGHLGLADERRPGADQPGRDRAPLADLVRRDHASRPALVRQCVQRHAPPVRRGLGRLRRQPLREHHRRRRERTPRRAPHVLIRAGRLGPCPVNVPAGGSVVITVDKTAGNSAVLAGLFLGGAEHPATAATHPAGRQSGRPGQLGSARTATTATSSPTGTATTPTWPACRPA